MWYEIYYNHCQHYIYVVQHSNEFSREYVQKIVKEQRMREGEFAKQMTGRRNITYSNYCSYMNKQNVLNNY